MVDSVIRLYDQNETSFSNNGLGGLNDATKCVVVEERNGEYVLDMEYPVNGKRYHDLMLRRIIFAKPNPYDDPQPFRIYSISRPLKGIVRVSAAHISYDLTNYVCLPFVAGSYAEVQSRLNDPDSHYPSNLGFNFIFDPNIGLSTEFEYDTSVTPIVDKRFKVLVPRSMRQIMGDDEECILQKILIPGTKLKCEYYYDKFTVHLNAPTGSNARGKDRGFQIRYGKNMTDIEKEESSDNDYTHIFPFWKSLSDGATAKILDDGGRVVPIPGASQNYTKIKIVDLSSDFEEQPTASKMREYANDYIAKEQLDGQADINITVNFQTLSKSSEYSHLSGLEVVKLCDTVTVIHEGLGISDTKKVIKTEYDALTDQYISVEIGTPKDEIAETIGASSASVNINTDVTSIIKDTLVNAVKDKLTIYYLDTHGTYSEANPPVPTAWVTDNTGAADRWTKKEPDVSSGGVLYSTTQTETFKENAAGTIVSFGATFIDKAKTKINDWLDPDNDTLNGEHITDESVDTPQIADEAIVRDKLSSDAIKSSNYEGPEGTSHFAQSGTYLDLAYGTMSSKNLAIDSDGNLYIKGQVNADSGYIGHDGLNGWKITSDGLVGTFEFDFGDGETQTCYAYLYPTSLKFAPDLSAMLAGRDSYSYSELSVEQLSVTGSNPAFDSGREYKAYLTSNVLGFQHATGTIYFMHIPDNSDTFRVGLTRPYVIANGTFVLGSNTYIQGHTSESLYSWISGIESQGYVLPPATSSTLGGVKIGSGVNVAADGTISVSVTPYVLPTASSSTLGGVKIGSGVDISSGVISVPIASETVAGRIKINANDGLSISSSGALSILLGSSFYKDTDAGGTIELYSATASRLGGVKIGSGINLNNGVISVTPYALPTASSSTLGGVKIGSGINISSGVISVTPYTLPKATSSVLGGVKIGSGINVNDGVISVTPYTLPTATSSRLGGVKIDDAKGLEYDNSGKIWIKAGNGLSFSSETGELICTVPSYTLPKATSSVLGGVKIGSGINVNDGVISVTPYTLPTASSSTLGGVKIGSNISVSADGTISVAAPYTLPTASSSTLGGVKIGSGINISSGVISVTPYTLPTASDSRLGGVMIGTNEGLDYNQYGKISVKIGSGLAIDGDSGAIYCTVPSYTLPKATSSVLGGVKIGSGINVNDGTISVTPYTLPKATTSSLGGVIIGSGISVNDGTISVTPYTLPTATSSRLGGVKIDDAKGLEYDNNGKVWIKAGDGLGFSSETGELICTVPSYTLPKATSSVLGGVKIGSGINVNDGVISVTPYTLPTASSSTLGGVKIGSGINISSGVISVTPYTLPKATSSVLGGVKIGSGVSVAADGTISVSVTPYVLPTASSSTLGGVKIGSGINISSGVISVPIASETTAGRIKVNANDGFEISSSGALSILLGSSLYKDTEGGGTIDVYPATASRLGGVKIGSGINVNNGVISVTPYTLPTATSSRLGGVKQGTGVTIAADGTISVTGGGGGTFYRHRITMYKDMGSDVVNAVRCDIFNRSSAAIETVESLASALDSVGTQATGIMYAFDSDDMPIFGGYPLTLTGARNTVYLNYVDLTDTYPAESSMRIDPSSDWWVSDNITTI